MLAVVTEESEWATALGAALSDLLREAGHPKKWLADRIDVDASTISRILNGERPPSIDQLARMARALGVTRHLILARAGYLDSCGSTIDLDSLPPVVRAMVVASVEVGIAKSRQEDISPRQGRLPSGDEDPQSES